MAPPTATETVTKVEAQKAAVVAVPSHEAKKKDQWTDDVHFLGGKNSQ